MDIQKEKPWLKSVFCNNRALARQFMKEYKKKSNFADRLMVNFLDPISKLMAKIRFKTPALNGMEKAPFHITEWNMDTGAPPQDFFEIMVQNDLFRD